jgi:methyl-accepting chemotaxis protein
MTFRWKLMLSVLVINLVCASTISFIDANRIQKTYISENLIQQQAIQDQIVSAIQDVQKAYDLFDVQMNDSMKQYFDDMIEQYEQNPDFSLWDLQALKQKYGHIDIYILNSDLVVKYATVAKDIGLDFKTFGSFAKVTRDRLNGDKFAADSISLETSSGNLMKYSYMPTPDHKYLLEFGFNIENGDIFKSFNFLDVYKKMTQKYENVHQVVLYANKGESFGAVGEGNKPIHLSDDKFLFPVFNKTIETNQIQSIEDTYNGKSAIYKFVPIHNEQTTEAIEVVFDNTALENLISQNQRTLFIELACIVLFSLVVTYLLSNLALNPIRRLTSLIRKTSHLDFTDEAIENKLLNSKDEFGDISRSIMDMRREMKGMAEKLTSVSISLTQTAVSLNDAASLVNEQTLQTSGASSELNTIAQSTVNDSRNISERMSSMKEVISGLKEQTDEAYTASQNVRNHAQDLMSDAITSKESAVQIYSTVKNQVEQAIEQSKTVQEINEMAETIMQISNQIRLLSLNARIEAARAGEEGRGFAVVASEIQKLADESSASVSTIGAISGKIEQTVVDLSQSSEEILGFIDHKVLPHYEQLIHTSQQYDQDSKLFSDLLLNFNTKSLELNNAIQENVESINRIFRSLDESSAAIQGITTQTEIIVEQNQEVYRKAEDSTVNANKLKSVTDRFKI